jgi:hypothetical protein
MPNKLEPIETTGGWIDGHLVELMFDREQMKTAFVVKYPDGLLEICMNVIIKGREYIPQHLDDLLTKNIVLLPMKLGKSCSLSELRLSIWSFLDKYFDFKGDEFNDRQCNIYVLNSWIYDNHKRTPYLWVTGNYGSGKTRLLDTVGCICYRPMRFNVRSTASAILRSLDLYHGTLLLDEVDYYKSSYLSNEIEIINNILSAGTYKGNILSLEMDLDGEIAQEGIYNVYGPKVITTLKEFNDQPFKSRFLKINLGDGKLSPRIPQILPDKFWQEAEEVRNLLLAYRMANAKEIK